MNAHVSIPQDAKGTAKEQLLKAGYQELGEFDSTTKQLVNCRPLVPLTLQLKPKARGAVIWLVSLIVVILANQHEMSDVAVARRKKCSCITVKKW